ncbi:MAG TPA: TIM barrel protein [Candidatus Hydrogenedentes bacterium]|nr:TIM barrel protein [Candidatus Hydrogenedentota bacterium]HPG69917.1 TIM barrel protein [Candidatus Hydrogenedentota bacterium]
MQPFASVLAAAVIFAATLVSAESPETVQPVGPRWPFFAFCMDTHDSQHRTIEQQAALLKELGYAGAGHLWLDNLDERLRTLDAAGLELFQVYLRVNIAGKDAPYDPRLREALPLLKGRRTMLAVLMMGLPPSDPSGDVEAVRIVREIADLAEAQGVRVALYPHFNDWLERVEDGLRIVQKAERPNVGVMFNLCHWLRVDDEANLRPLLESAMPHLFAVSLHGADHAVDIRAGTGNWIQPLDSGAFDILGLLKTLRDLEYAGPVGLQCYGLEGDARDHLTRSVAAWKTLTAGLDAP